MSRSLVIVGSGNSLLGSKLGSFIDSQDAVVRFGGGETCIKDIAKFKKDVGSKTTHLIQNFNLAALRRFTARFDKNSKFYYGLESFIYAHAGLPGVLQKVHLLTNYNKLIDAKVPVVIQDIVTYCNLKLAEYSKFLKTPDASSAVKNIFEFKPTSGFFALLYFFSQKEFSTIYVCGFDALSNRNCVDGNAQDLTFDHFYGSTPCELGEAHRPFNEAAVIRILKSHMPGVKFVYTDPPYPRFGDVHSKSPKIVSH